MATRYLVAMDHVDLHAQRVMKKYAQNRPLGDIERKYNYSVPQPTLSFRSVEVDSAGARKYRPKSSIDIFREQQQRFHDSYPRPRVATSAPPVRHGDSRNSPRILPNKSQHTCSINVSVEGRPATSWSERPVRSPSTPAKTRKRPKTTGQLKKSRSVPEFMVVKVDPDILVSSQRRKELTRQIRQQWADKNHDLSSGQLSEGRSSGTVLSSTSRSNGQWLTFGSTNQSDNQGIIDVFTNVGNDQHKYNIDGYSGSRVAQQLQKGGKIRIGVNGCLSGTESTKINQVIDDSSRSEAYKPVSLCWTDEVWSPKAKVLQARLEPSVVPKPILSETYPVVFRKLLQDEETTLPSQDVNCKRVNIAPNLLSAVERKPAVNSPTDTRVRGSLNIDFPLPPSVAKKQEMPTRDDQTMSVNLNGLKVDEDLSLSNNDQCADSSSGSGKPKQSFDKKTGKHVKGRTYKQEPSSQVRPPKIKPTPASFLTYRSTDPKLCINAASPKGMTSSQDNSKVAMSNKGGYNFLSSSPHSYVPTNPPPTEFIHFSTGLVNPYQRRTKSPKNTTSIIDTVKEHNQRRINEEISDKTSPNSKKSIKPEVPLRVYEAASPLPPTSAPPGSPVPQQWEEDKGHTVESPLDTQSVSPRGAAISAAEFAFSIPTADERAHSAMSREEPFNFGDEKHAENDVSNLQQAGSAIKSTHSEMEQLAAVLRSSLVSPSNKSLGDTDSSLFNHSEEELPQTPRSSCKTRHSVRFHPQTKQPEPVEDNFSTKVGDLLLGQNASGFLNTSIEVKRLRQQIKDDLVRQQEDTEADIEYLRLRQSTSFT